MALLWPMACTSRTASGDMNHVAEVSDSGSIHHGVDLRISKWLIHLEQVIGRQALTATGSGRAEGHAPEQDCPAAD